MKPLVIYHDHCTDGFGAAFAAWKALGDDAEYAPVAYGQPQNWPGNYEDRDVYIIDFSFPRSIIDGMFTKTKRVVWLDHHKTAFEMWCETEREKFVLNDTSNNVIILDNNKSGAYLAWEYFHPNTEVPLLIRHIDDRDRWQFKLEGTKEFHAALAAHKPWSFEQWENEFLYSFGALTGNSYLYTEGSAILTAQGRSVTSAIIRTARKCRINSKEGVISFDGLSTNCPLYMSEIGHELANRSGSYGLIWYLGADNRVKCSLRSNGDYDVSAIAKLYGGGGHKNAAGFEVPIDTLLTWLD